MTLKYVELMVRIEVTPEMRQRILKNIETADLTPDKKVLRLHHLKQYLAAAACFALLITGIYTLPQGGLNLPPPARQSPPQSTALKKPPPLKNYPRLWALPCRT